MADLAKRKVFMDDGRDDRSHENFQGVLFDSVDFRERSSPISFYRSDFRSVLVRHSTFLQNNFDRADFVDALILDSTVEKCEFGTDFINTVFEGCLFSNNDFGTCSFVRCYFNNCSFSGNTWKNTDIRECRFQTSDFQADTFAMNTAVDLTFTDCKLADLDLSNQSALDFKFRNCDLSEVIMDPDPFGSYLFVNTDIGAVKFSYRGEILDAGQNAEEALLNLGKLYQSSNRFFEMYNSALLLHQRLNLEYDLQTLFQEALSGILRLPHPLKRIGDLNRLSHALTFYLDEAPVGISLFLRQLDMVEAARVEEDRLQERIVLMSTRSTMEEHYLEKQFSVGAALPPQGLWYMRIRIEVGAEEELLAALGTLFAAGATQMSRDGATWKVVAREAGSVILTIASIAALVVFVCACIRKVSQDAIRICYNAKVIKAIGKMKTVKDIKQGTKMVRGALKVTNGPGLNEAAKSIGRLMLDKVDVIVESTDD